MEWEREGWIEEYLAGEAVSEIARRHGISRKALYKWIGRYEQFGVEGLRDLSRAPHEHPRAVEPLWQERVRAARQGHPRWGPRKLRWWLEQEYEAESVPSASTIGRLLQQWGLSRSKRTARPANGTGKLWNAQEPNQVWAVDFKGWCRTGDGQRCEPLTMTDQATRYLLCCQAMESTRTELVRPVMERVFREYGLPERLRSDNGPPFGSNGACGLTALAVWWIELGIECERIERGRPQQNGRHERMHRTLDEETMQPPAATLRRQQHRLDRFQREYNEQRPHEAIGMEVPGKLYQAARRAYPERIEEPEYDRGWLVKRVAGGGQLSWASKRVFVSHALAGKAVGLEPAGDRLWRVWFRHHWLGMWEPSRWRLWRPQQWSRRQQRRSGPSE